MAQNIAPQHYEKPVNTVCRFRYDFLGSLDVDVNETIVSITSLTEIGSSDFAGKIEVVDGGFNTAPMVVGARTCEAGQVVQFRVREGGTVGQVYDIRILALTSEGDTKEGHALFSAIA